MTDFEQALAWFNSRPVKARVGSFSDYEVKFTGTVSGAEAFVVAQGESLEVLKRFTYRDGLRPLPGDVQGDLYIDVDQPPMKCTCKCGGCGGVADAADSCWCWACRVNGCVTREQMAQEAQDYRLDGGDDAEEEYPMQRAERMSGLPGRI